jgi:hypothetical protein
MLHAKMARTKSFEGTPPTKRGFRLAGANNANASVRPCRAVCGRRSIPPLTGEIMKNILLSAAFLFFILPFSSFASNINEVHLSEYTDINGVKTKFVTSLDVILKTPEWKENMSNPPLPLPKAVSLATVWMKKRNPKFDDFIVSGITIRRIGSSDLRNRWDYLIDFNAIVDRRTVYGSTFVAIVLMDGTIIEPKITKK